MAKSTSTATQTAKPSKTRRYRILQGKHVEGNKKNGVYAKGDRGPGVYRVYDSRDTDNCIIETDVNLLMFNSSDPAAPRRFCLATDQETIAKHVANNSVLEDMTEEQIRNIAASNEVDIERAANKEEMIDILRKSGVNG